MKPAAYRISLLAGCAAFTLCVTQNAGAFGSAEPEPSIEIHLDALSQLEGKGSPTPLMPDAAAPASSASDASPFGKPTPPPRTPVKSADATPLKHKIHHVAANTPAGKAKPAKEAIVADMAPPPAPVASVPAPPAPAPAVTKTEDKPLPAATREIPKPDAKTVVTEPAIPPVPNVQPPAPAPAPMQAAANPPKPPEPTLPQKAASEAAGGLADMLSDDPVQKPAPAEPAKAASAMPPAAPVTALASPPAEMMQPAPLPSQAAKNAPPALSPLPAPADAPPPLAPVPSSSADKNADKVAMASNDVPPPPASAPVMALEPTKPDLPALPSGSVPARQQMAQATLTPLAVPPAPPAPPQPSASAASSPASSGPSLPEPPKAPVLPETPPALSMPSAPAAMPAPQTPAMSAPVPAPATASAPVPDAPIGAKPDLRIVFNESETDVPLGSTAKLDALAATLAANSAARVTIMAYASGPETTGIYPKRVSLARGIAVRNYLTSNKGVDIERVNVKALGNKDTAGGPGDRVDMFVLK